MSEVPMNRGDPVPRCDPFNVAYRRGRAALVGLKLELEKAIGRRRRQQFIERRKLEGCDKR